MAVDDGAGSRGVERAGARDEPSGGLANLLASGVIVLLLAASAALFVLSVPTIGKSADQCIAPAVGAGLGIAGLIAAAWLLVHREAQRRHAAVLLQLPALLRDLDQEMASLEAVRREHAKLNMSIKGIREGLSEDGRVAQIQREGIASAGEGVRRELGEFRGELIELRQQLEEERAERGKLDSVLGAAADGIFRRQDLDGFPELLEDFASQLKILGLDLIFPPPNSPINDRLHSIVEERDEDGILPLHVVKCLALGFRRGSKVLRAASVITTPENTEPDGSSDDALREPLDDRDSEPDTNQAPPSDDEAVE